MNNTNFRTERLNSLSNSCYKNCYTDYLRDTEGIVIQRGSGAILGNCYCSNEYKITSKNELLNSEIEAIRKLNLIGYGQEYRILPPKGINKEGEFEYIIIDRIDSSD